MRTLEYQMKMRTNEDGIHLLQLPCLAEEVNLEKLSKAHKIVATMLIVDNIFASHK